MISQLNGVVELFHEKDILVMLMTLENVQKWSVGSSLGDAFKMQTPAPDDAIVVRPTAPKAA